MYIAMNRFKVHPEEQAPFRTRWFDRQVYLKTVPGFVAFHLLQGPVREDHVLYASHTVWRSHADFEAWTRSEQFRAAHADAGSGRSLTLTHPEFEGFEVLQEITADGDASRDASVLNAGGEGRAIRQHGGANLRDGFA